MKASSSTGSWSVLRTHKLRRKRPMKEERRRVKTILLFGRRRSRMSRSGLLLGEKEGLAGTSSAPRWRAPFSAKRWTFTLEVSISSSRITRTSLPNLKRTTMSPTGSNTSSMSAICTSTSSRCRKAWRTSSLLRNFSILHQPGQSNYTFSFTGTMWFSAMTLRTRSDSLKRKTNVTKISLVTSREPSD